MKLAVTGERAETWVWRKENAIDNAVASTPARETRDAGVEELAAKASRGEKDALESLCRKIAKGVLARVRFLYRGSDAEDIAQEALIRVCERIHTLKDPKAFGAWMHRIVTNEVYQEQRKGGEYGSVVYLDEVSPDLTDDSDISLPHEYLLQKEETRVIMEIINEFPQRQREAVLLHYYDGMSVTDMAKTMGIAHSNVSQYLTLAKKKMHRELTRRQGYTANSSFPALALLPAGGLIKRAVTDLLGKLSPEDAQWGEGAAATALGTAAVVKGAAVVASTVTLSAVTVGTVSTVVGGIVTLLAAVGMAGVMLFGGARTADVHVDGVISFPGGHLNPTAVSVEAESEYGEMTPLRWKIIPEGETEALYSGEGEDADAVLSGMAERGESGEYTIGFYMRDSEGTSGWLKKQFIILSGN